MKERRRRNSTEVNFELFCIRHKENCEDSQNELNDFFSKKSSTLNFQRNSQTQFFQVYYIVHNSTCDLIIYLQSRGMLSFTSTRRMPYTRGACQCRKRGKGLSAIFAYIPSFLTAFIQFMLSFAGPHRMPYARSLSQCTDRTEFLTAIFTVIISHMKTSSYKKANKKFSKQPFSFYVNYNITYYIMCFYNCLAIIILKYEYRKSDC